jgi:hypothetical protein
LISINTLSNTAKFAGENMNGNSNNYRDRRKERRNKGRATEAERQALQKIDRHQEETDQQAARVTRSIYLGKRAFAAYQKVLNSAEPAYRNLNISQKMALYFVLMGTFSVVVINLLLIKAPVEYIIKLTGASEFLQTVGTIILPILLLIFELATGAQLQVARDQDDEDAERTWIMLGWFLIFFTPLMVLGTYIAGGLLVQPANWILMITLMIIAGGTDAFIVNGYDLIDKARGFAAYQMGLAIAKGQVHRQAEKFNKAKNMVSRAFARLVRLYERHNERYPHNPIPPLAFPHTTAWLINHARGHEAITEMPPRPRELDFEFFDNLDWNQPLPRRRRPPEDLDDGMTGGSSPTPPPRAPQGDVMDENVDADDAAAERDFYRDQLRRNAQQNEREVRP